jgi:uncharacterized protein DUF4345
MKDTILVKLVLALSGIIGLGIGLAVLLWPRAFFASSGTILGDDISLMSEIRAPAVILVLFGGVMLWAIFASHLRQMALRAAALLYLSYAAGRLISLMLDGIPHTNILAGLAVELFIGLLCVFVLWSHRKTA